MSTMNQIRDLLKSVAGQASGWAEFRFHRRESRIVGVRRGEVSEMSSKSFEGVGVRVLLNGVWGFASTGEITRDGITGALQKAEKMALGLQSLKKKKISLRSTKKMAKGEYKVSGYEDMRGMDFDQKFQMVRKAEEDLRGKSKSIEAASSQYAEVFEDKIIVTTDGADAVIQLVRPELRFAAFASDGAKRTMGYDSVGVTGGWTCLFQNRNLEQYLDNAAQSAVDLLKAPGAQGGRKKVILSPAIVGLLCHEAIGHTVEADFVKSGSVAQGKIQQQVASPLVTLCDSGISEHQDNAGGSLPVDDEGVLTEKTQIIRDGKLVSYLHNRQSAAEFDVEPTGNARAWEYHDEPLIRMRNTYIEPGESNLDQMIAGIDDGFFVDGAQGGQADATGEFMFGANRVHRIQNGKITELVQPVTLSGIAFDVLRSVDAVSKDFRWDLGSGHCGKGQPAKVDAGGPYVRCEILVGGVA